MIRSVFHGLLCCIAFASLIALSGCGKLEGEFGFKGPFEDDYRKIAKTPEFKDSEKKEWVFVFRKLTEPHEIGVFILKKEVVWAEVTHYTQKVDKSGNVVYGNIEHLQEGRYKIVLVEKQELIAEKEFIVYNDEEIQ